MMSGFQRGSWAEISRTALQVEQISVCVLLSYRMLCIYTNSILAVVTVRSENSDETVLGFKEQGQE